MVRRKIDGSKAGYRSSVGREHLGGNKLKRRGEREKGEEREWREERREGEEERRRERGEGEEEEGREGRREGVEGGEEDRSGCMCIYGHTFSSWSHPQRGWVLLLVPPTERLGTRLMPFKPCQQLSVARQ